MVAMPAPRYQRRKDERPAEITAAALEVFSEHGYSAARVDDVARKAGVSKGLLYVYFKTKEELFKAVIRSFVAPKVDALIDNFNQSELSSEEFLRGPFLTLAKQIPKSPARILIRMMIAEGPKHPDLVAFYWENVVSRGIQALQHVIERGIAAGEFRETALLNYPQLLVSPVLMSVIWNAIFSRHRELDTDDLIEAHLDMVLRSISATGESS
jgi:AcrR family transcriptional regulator